MVKDFDTFLESTSPPSGLSRAAELVTSSFYSLLAIVPPVAPKTSSTA